MFDSIDHVVRALSRAGYFIDRDVATATFLASRMGKPLLVEGEPGSGKTELARSLARATGGRLIRLQCYPGIEPRHALYEWNAILQLSRIHRGQLPGAPADDIERELFTAPYMIRRPIFDALLDTAPIAPVLLIDAVDRSDASFEAMLAEILDAPTIIIPETGEEITPRRPLMLLTSNGSRPTSETLRRHSMYAWLAHPSFEREMQIVMARVPGITRALAGQLCNYMVILRGEPFIRRPGIAETIDWGAALVTLRHANLDPEVADQTLGCFLKDPGDIERFRTRGLAQFIRPVMDRAG